MIKKLLHSCIDSNYEVAWHIVARTCLLVCLEAFENMHVRPNPMSPEPCVVPFKHAERAMIDGLSTPALLCLFALI